MAALNWTTVDTTIKAWLDAAASSCTWYRADQDVPLQSSPRGSWKYRTTNAKPPVQGQLPDAVIMDSGTKGNAQILKHRRHQLQIDITSADVLGSDSAREIGQAVLDRLELRTQTQAFRDAGIRVVPLGGGVRDLTRLQPDRAESRAIVECVCYTVADETEDVSYIQTATPLPGS